MLKIRKVFFIVYFFNQLKSIVLRNAIIVGDIIL